MKQYKNNVDRPVGAILSLNTIAHTIGSAGVGRIFRYNFGYSDAPHSGAFGNHS